MKKTFLFYFCIVLGLLSFSPKIMAQTDVTSTYLSNAGFDTDCHYVASAESSNLASAGGGANLHAVDSWTLSTTGDNSAASTFEFGYAGTLNGNTIPTAGYDEPSSAGCLGISAAWSATIAYTQEVTSLTGGKYALVYVAYNSGPNATDYSRAGWAPDGGSAVLSAKTSFAMNEWSLDTVYFVVPDDATGKIQVGIASPNSGSGSVGRIFFDWVKLIYYGVDKADLTTIIEEATALYNVEDIGADALNTAITTAQAVADDANATQTEVLTAIDDLKNAIWVYKVANASNTNPLDCTSFIINPSFEDNFTGWTNNGFARATNSPLYTKDGSAHIEKYVAPGNAVPDCSVSQTVDNLPNGLYKVTLSALSRINQNGTEPADVEGAYLFANTGSTVVSTAQDYVVDAIVSDNTLTLGFKTESSTANWVSADNFRLTYLGVDLSVLEEALAGLKTEAENISGTMQTAVATELAAAITEAETALSNQSESALNAATTRLTNAIAAANASIAAYSSLLTDITAANAYKETHSDLEGLSDFETAIATAQAVYDALDANVSEVADAQTNLASAWKTFRYANTIDLTAKIIDAPVTNASYWTSGRTNTGEQYTGAPDNTYLDYYNANYDGYQTISGLPDGEYILKAAVRASGLDVGNLYASSGENEYLHPVIGIGNTGNELDKGWYWAEIFGITVSEGTLKIGIKGSATSNRWIGADDFHLYYVGSAQVKSVLEETIGAVTDFLETIDATTAVGDDLGQYTSDAYDDLSTALAAAITVYEDESALQDDINDAEAALSSALAAFKASYQMEKNSLPEGDYYIKKAGSDLYWTNMKAVTNEEKPEFKELYETNIDEQLWIISMDNGYYKIVNLHEDEYSGGYYQRFITEKGTFPQSGKIASGYSQAWNTFDFFYNGTAYAVQRTQSASHEFWRLDASNYIIWTSTTLDASTDFILEFVSVADALSAAIIAGQALLDAAVIGTANGEYLQGVYDAFATAISTASTAVSAGATAQDLIDFKAAEALFVPNSPTAINGPATENKASVTVTGKAIAIRSAVPVKAAVYTATGLLIKETTVEGQQTITVAPGVYIVKAGANNVKVIVQ